MSPSEVIAAAAVVCEVSPEEITSSSKKHLVSWARFMAAAEIARIRSWWTQDRLAREIGRVDHGSAIYAIQRHSELIAATPSYKALHGRLIEELQKLQTNPRPCQQNEHTKL